VIGRLRRAGVLGINARNTLYTLRCNPRSRYPLVDDKLASKRACQEAGIPVPKLLAVARVHLEAKRLPKLLRGERSFVLKPARGAMGNGIVLLRRAEDGSLRRSGRPYSEAEFVYHAAGIISGLYSLAGHVDVAMVEECLEVHPGLAALVSEGVPDVRVIVYRGIPVMAMTRLPTRASGGRANLHQGALGVGIDLSTGRTVHAMLRNRPVRSNPETGRTLLGHEIPSFDRVLEIAVAATDQVGLGYVGADVVVDAQHGPVILELNARPGLAIQIANRAGLRPWLDAVDRALGRADSDFEQMLPVPERVELGREIARAARAAVAS
jgi:alpha-L-glutamate ligase-like protein